MHNFWNSLSEHLQLPSPLQSIFLSDLSISISVKREDLIHPSISGNKWRKLEGFLESYRHSGILTLGGPFSNHLHAIASLCKVLSIPLVCLVRGQDADLHNPTLSDVQKWGGKVIKLDRSTFRAIRSRNSLPEDLRRQYRDWCFIPEGGLGDGAILGIKHLALEIGRQFDRWPDIIVLPMGTGTTAYILRHFIPATTRMLGVRAVIDSGLRDRLKQRFPSLISEGYLEIIEGYEWGGFGRYDASLLEWMDGIASRLQLPLDLVYNSKAFYALYDLISKGEISSDQSILYLHTGGLQGNRSLDYFSSQSSAS